MKKKEVKKLHLSTETLQILAGPDCRRVIGGVAHPSEESNGCKCYWSDMC